MEVFHSLAVQVGINPPSAQVGVNLCYLFHLVWSSQPSRHAIHAQKALLASRIAKMGMWNFSVRSFCFWTSPEAAHLQLLILAANDSWCSFSVAPFTSYIPANALNPSYLKGLKHRTPLGGQQTKDFLQHRVHTGYPMEPSIASEATSTSV